MEPLIFKIETQADDSGVRKFDKSVGGLDVSSRKASGALKSFAQDIAQARDGSDVASAALGAFSRILGSSLAATGVIIGVKTVIDGFSKIEQAVKESEKAVADAFAGMESSGKALTFADAVGQAKTFEGVAKKITEEIKKINESPMLNIIDGLMQSTDRMRELAKQSEDQAIAIRKAGAESELAHLSRIKGLDAEGKALAANERALEKELEGIDAIKEASTALAITQKYAMQADEIRAKFADERAKFADERGKVEEELATQKQKQLDDTIKKEKELGEAQQKRFNELYDAEIKAQEATQKRIDANIKAQEQEQKKLEETQKAVDEGKKAQEKSVGAGAEEIAARPAGQRETSFQRGLRQSISRAEEKGKRQAQEAVQKDIGEQLKAQGLPSGGQDVQREIVRRAEESGVQRGQIGVPGFKELKETRQAQAELTQAETQRIDDMAKSALDFRTNLSDLKTPFDDAMNSADNFADGMTENSGNMIGDFLKTGKESDELGKDFDRTGDEVNRFGEAVRKSTPPPSGKKDGAGKDKGSLGSIEELLKKNFDELKAYAHAT